MTGVVVILVSLLVLTLYGMARLILLQVRSDRQRTAELAAGADLADRVREFEGQW